MAVVLLGGGAVAFDRFVLLETGPASASAVEPSAAGATERAAAHSEGVKLVPVSRMLETLREQVDSSDEPRDAFALPIAWQPVQAEPAQGQAKQAPITPDEFVRRHMLTDVRQKLTQVGRVESTFAVAVLDGQTELRVIDEIDGYKLELITPDEARFVGPDGVIVRLSRGEPATIERR